MTIQIDLDKYNELIEKAECLYWLEKAVKECNPYSPTEIEMVKKIFGLEE